MPRRARAKSEPAVARVTAVRAPDVSIEEVQTAQGRDDFVRFPLSMYEGDPNYVTPIIAERRDFIDPQVNPFFQEATAVFFLARRRGTVVGRIAAFIDRRYNRFHGTSSGGFGLFDCHQEPGVAAALVEAAVSWVRRQGCTTLMGPLSFAFHHEAGLLVEGFDRPPSMLMPYNAPYYASLLEACGFAKKNDLCSYEMTAQDMLPEKVQRLAERARASGVVVRRIDTRRPERDLLLIRAVLDGMLTPGFGFAPMNDGEFAWVVNRLKPVVLLRPELALIAEVNGEAVAFIVTLPDMAVAQQKARGRLFPFGLLKILWAAREVDRLRVMMFGIKNGFRRRGIDALLAVETQREAARLGYETGEVGWAVADDLLVNRTIQALGARRIKTYRVYERAV
jgi:GNAT superfamily N-acetyltransferase